MATLFTWTDGTLPSVTGSNVTLNTGTGHPSAGSIQIAQAASSAAYAYWDSGAAQVTLRLYVKTPVAWPANDFQLAGMGVIGSDPAGDIRFNISGSGSPGQIRFRTTGGTQVAASAQNTILVDTWYRVEMQLDTTTSRGRLAVFPIRSTTAIWDSGWISNAGFATMPTRIHVGRVVTTPTVGTFLVDSVQATDSIANWIGPVAGDEPAGATVQVWNGTSLQSVASVQVWDGSTLRSIGSITVA